MRGFFADGVNSAAHVGLGYTSAIYAPLWGSLLFLVYQLTQEDQTNTGVDLAEFVVGYLFGAQK